MATNPRPPTQIRLVRYPSLVVFAAALAHSLCMFLAFAPVGWWPMAFISVLPLFLVVQWWAGRGEAAPGMWRALLAAWLGAVPFWAFTEWWIADVSAAGYPCLTLIQSFWPALFVVLGIRGVRSRRLPAGLVMAVLWTGIEYFRGELFGHGYAWSLIAYPLIDAPMFAAPARIGGVYFVTLLTCLPAGAVIAAVARRAKVSAAMIGSWALVTLMAAFAMPQRAPSPTPREVRIAAVQTNIEQGNKLDWSVEQEVADLNAFIDLSEQAASQGAELIAWPETMMPGLTLEPSAIDALRRSGTYFTIERDGREQRLEATYFAERLKECSTRVRVPMLIGEDARVGFEVREQPGGGVEFESKQRFNSVYMVEDGRVSDQRYDKVRLTPFGETMPYIASIPGLQQKLLDFGARGMRFDLSEGTRQTVFTFNTAGGSVRVVTPICFEVTVAPYVRGMVFEKGVRRADILVNVTNDGWFGGFSPAREQHLQIARWRSLELATPMIRAANTGISCSISADGKVHQLGPQNGVAPSLSQGLLIAGVEPGTKVTIYARLGEFTGWSTVVGTLAIAMFAGRRAAKGGQTANPPIGGGVA